MVFKMAVTAPAAKPAAMARKRDKNGFTPLPMATAETGGPQGQAAVDGEIRKIKNPEGQVDPQGHDAVKKALFQGTDPCVECQGFFQMWRDLAHAGPVRVERLAGAAWLWHAGVLEW